MGGAEGQRMMQGRWASWLVLQAAIAMLVGAGWRAPQRRRRR